MPPVVLPPTPTRTHHDELDLAVAELTAIAPLEAANATAGPATSCSGAVPGGVPSPTPPRSPRARAR